MTKPTEHKPEHSAHASMRNLPISWKHGIEISNTLRYRSTAYAKKFLEDVVALRRPVSFTRFTLDVGHKPGMASGRYPQKAAQEFLKLIKSVEANAQVKGLNTASLKITKLITNRAPKAPSAGRKKHDGKQTHLEIEVQEGTVKKAAEKKIKPAPKITPSGETQ
ncbi:MAG TPA: 50S ribosomal protein L22 [Candidatus Nanoarchaeia archaeon]|nr:50S ribosomal protein L22 [Candidatus Nanoarchaeia archaeon]